MNGPGLRANVGSTGRSAASGPSTRRGEAAAFAADEAEPAAAASRRARWTPTQRWIGWRLRMLVVCALAGCVGLFALVHALVAEPALDATWDTDEQGGIVLASSGDPALQPYLGHVLTAVTDGVELVLADEALLAPQVPRWIVDDDARARRLAADLRLRHLLASSGARLVFDDGAGIGFTRSPRPLTSLPIVVWLLLGFGFALYLVAMVVLLAHPCVRNVVYAAMALAQSANLLLVAVATVVPLGPTPGFPRISVPLSFALDWITAAAAVNAASLHPRRLPGGTRIAAATWAITLALVVLGANGMLPRIWWWGQATVALFGATAIGLFSWSYRIEPHPFAIALRRFGIVMLASWVALTVAVAQFGGLDEWRPFATAGPVVWYLFLGSLLLLVPFLARSQDFMREFAMLAAISTVATTLDLIFVAVFSLGAFASLALALFASLAVYTGVRQWILNRLLGENLLTTERMFEQLYRTAREVEAHAERAPALLGQLLDRLFEPLEIEVSERPVESTRVNASGSSLRVPVPWLGAGVPSGSLALRYARRGRRLFTAEDARLADRIVEQLRRAVDFDRAVEQGRSEERQRIAQDLHDDIGARLLTLMYQAASPEMEDYVRRTLQDFKTLTRGLAAASHPLSHAAAEWKSDVAQRAAVAGIEVEWTVRFDDDVMLSVVQWSALTRVIRELVTNAIVHARARRIEVEFGLEANRVTLRVADDGQGRRPETWSHGLGLGGVRKRVAQLGGEVEWRERPARGIECRVRIAAFMGG